MKKVLFLLSLLMVVVGLVGCINIYPEYTIEISASTTEAKAGEEVTLSYTLTPEADHKVVNWVFVKGEEFATLEDLKLIILEEAAPGAEIVLKATLEDVVSNQITIKVVKPVESLAVSASSNLVEPGQAVNLIAEVTPDDATDINVQWVITEGSDFGSIDTQKNQLFVYSNTAPGSVIKVKAVNGNVQSDVILITVFDPKQDEFRLVMPYDNVEIDINATSKTIKAQIFNGHFVEVFDQEIEFSVIEGEDLLDLEVNGYQCTLVALGHGQAKLRTQIKGTGIYSDMTVDVLVPPIALRLPGVFEERPNYNYSVGKSFELPFVPTAVKDEGVSKVSEDLVYTFTKNGSSEASDDIASVQDGKIIFKTTGIITVKVSSNSGSKKEASTQYTFSVNNGVTVTSYEEFKAAVEKTSRTVTEELDENKINVVILQKVTNENRYGYDLVPHHIIENYQDPLQQDIFLVQDTQIYGNGDYEIIGNNHQINLIDQRVLTEVDYDIIHEVRPGNKPSNVDDLLQFRAYVGVKTLKVYIRDLKIKGNCGIDFPSFSGETPRANGVHRYAIYLNKGNELNEQAALDTRIENVSITNFASGLFVRYAYNSLLTKVSIDNIFATGIAFMASKVELNDMTFGLCGAASFEFQGNNCNKAPTSKGPDAQFVDNQKGIISGYFITNNYNDGRTNYLSNYQKTLLSGNSIVDIIAMNLMRNLPAMNNVYNSNGEIIFAGLVFIGTDDDGGFILNSTEISIPWNVVDYDEMQPNDTTNKYVLLDLIVPIGGENYYLGKVLLVNFNNQEQ